MACCCGSNNQTTVTEGGEISSPSSGTESGVVVVVEERADSLIRRLAEWCGDYPIRCLILVFVIGYIVGDS